MKNQNTSPYAKMIANVLSVNLRTVKFIRSDATEVNLKVFVTKNIGEEQAIPEQDIYILKYNFLISAENNKGTSFEFPPRTDDQIEDSVFGRLGVNKVEPITLQDNVVYYKVEAGG